MATMVADLFARLGLKPDVKSWNKGDELISKIKTGLAFFAGFEAIKGVMGWITATADIGGHAADAAQKLGITAEAVQELGHAAKLSGVDQAGLESALGKLALNLDDVATKGKGPAADALRRLGVNFRELKGETLDQNLEVIADKFAAMPNGAKKASLAVDLFGKQGKELIPLLNEGAAGIVKLRNEAQEMGIVIDNEAADSLEKFGDDTDRVKETLGGLRNQVVVALLPTIQALTTGLLEWVKANREVIKNTIAGAVQVVINVARVLGKVIGGLVDVIAFFIEHEELGKSLLIGLGVVIAAFAVKAAVAWAIAFAPIIAAVAVITAVVLGIRMLIKPWDKVKIAARNAGTAIVGGFRSMWNGLKAVGNRIKEFFVEDIPNGIKAAFQAAWDSVVAGAKRIGSELRNLPIIKQLGDFGEFIGGKLASPPRMDGIDTVVPARADDQAALMRGPTSVVGGNIEININAPPGADAVAIGRDIEKRIDERMQTWLDQAEEVVG